MGAKKKKSFGAAAKYMTGSLISSPITHKVVQHPDGLLCAEIIREFMNFYGMNLSLQVFEPEMSISTGFPKTRSELERELGVDQTDPSKPMLLELLEKFKYQGAGSIKGGEKVQNPLGVVGQISNNFEQEGYLENKSPQERPKSAKRKSPENTTNGKQEKESAPAPNLSK